MERKQSATAGAAGQMLCDEPPLIRGKLAIEIEPHARRRAVAIDCRFGEWVAHRRRIDEFAARSSMCFRFRHTTFVISVSRLIKLQWHVDSTSMALQSHFNGTSSARRGLTRSHSRSRKTSDMRIIWLTRQPRWALLALRLAVGSGFVAHGLAKWNRGPDKFAKLLHVVGVPFALPTAWLVTLLEIFGGLAVLAGAFVAIVSIPLIISMLVAALTVQLRYGFSSVNTVGLTPTGPLFGPPGYEINLLYIGALIALALSQPTPLSFDDLMRRRE